MLKYIIDAPSLYRLPYDTTPFRYMRHEAYMITCKFDAYIQDTFHLRTVTIPSHKVHAEKHNENHNFVWPNS